MKAQLFSNMVIGNYYYYAKIYPANDVYNPNYYKSRIPIVTPQNSQVLSSLITVISNQLQIERY